MNRPRALRVSALAALGVACLLACRATTADPHRPVRRVPAVRQWQHEWARGAVFYEVFVRSFADSNGDGKGDLKGLISRLDYLNDGNPASSSSLGVDALWLMPVFASPSYHGYDTTDYENVNPDYGDDADLETLCREAHRRGMRVIVDFVMNHTSNQHPWFVDAASSPTARHRAWYIWSPTDLGWRQPWNIYGGADTWHRNQADGQWYYGVFWSGMPDLNYRNPEVRAEMERLAGLWLGRGVDGFRLDAARHIVENGPGLQQVDQPETHAFWKEFAAYVRSVRPDAVLVGENWIDTPTIATYYGSTAVVAGGDELPMNFDFPLSDAIVRGVNAGDASTIAAKLAEIQATYPAGVIDAPFLTNHDEVRVATQLGNDAGTLRSAAAVLLTLPGAPFLYYGEELGMQNGTQSNAEFQGCGDCLKRTPMPWDGSPGGGFTTGTPWFPFAPGRDSANVAAENADPGSLLARYRQLIRLRHTSAALAKGDVTILTPTAGGGAILAYLRSSGEERVLVATNLGGGLASGGPYAVAGTGFETLFSDDGVPAPGGSSGAITLTLPPLATGIWRVR